MERGELIGETGEPSYPHTCRRNHQDPWNRKMRTPVQFSSTPNDLFLFRVTSPQDDPMEEVRYNQVKIIGLKFVTSRVTNFFKFFFRRMIFKTIKKNAE